MGPSKRYRRYAADCLRVAQQTTNQADKALLVAMAEQWLQLADRAEQLEPSEVEGGGN